MTLVTITGDTIRDGSGRKDNRPWYFTPEGYQDGNPGVVTPRRSKPLIPSNGVLTAELEGGITGYIENPDGQRWLVDIPLVDSPLWDVIEAGVAYPPNTPQIRLDAAVVKYIEKHRAQFGLIAVPAAGDPTMAQWVRVDNGEAVGDPVPWSQVISEEVAANAAASAVDDYVSGELNLVQGSTDVEPGKVAHFGIRDKFNGVQFAANEDGTVDIPLPNLAGMPLRSAETVNGYLFGLRDAAGLISEFVVGRDGRFPDWVLRQWDYRQHQLRMQDWIVVCAGQSNMAGGDDNPPSGVYDTDPRLVRYDRSDGQLHTIAPEEGALYATLGRRLIQQAPSDVRVIVVQSAVGGVGFKSSSITPTPAGYEFHAEGTWDRTHADDPKNLYTRMVADVAAVRALSPRAKLAGLFWSHGEADSDMVDQAGYAALLDDLISAFRTAVSNSALPVVIGSLVPEYVGSSVLAASGSTTAELQRWEIQKALMDTPRRVANTAFVYGPSGMTRKDSAAIHFSNAGSMTRARMFADAIPRARWNMTTSRPTPPQNLRVSKSGTSLVVEYDPPLTRYTAITVEYSANSGAWTAMTKPGGDVGLSATATIVATDAIRIRARSTSDSTSGQTTSDYVYAAA